jgi:hypothetical protein
VPVPVPVKPRIGYGYYPWVKFHAHSRTRWVRYLWVKLLSLGPTSRQRWLAATHCRRMRAGGAPQCETGEGDGALTHGPRDTVRGGAVKRSLKLI